MAGAVPVEELIAKEQELERSREKFDAVLAKLEAHKREIERLSGDLGDVNSERQRDRREINRLNWTSARHVEFLPGQVFSGFVQNTVDAWGQFGLGVEL